MKETIKLRPSLDLLITIFPFLRVSTIKPTISSGHTSTHSLLDHSPLTFGLTSTSSLDGKFGLTLETTEPHQYLMSCMLHLPGDGLTATINFSQVFSELDGITELSGTQETTSTSLFKSTTLETSASAELLTCGQFNSRQILQHLYNHAGLTF